MLYLIVDASPLIYQSYKAMGHFSNSAGEPTGLRFAFLRAIRSYVKKVKADKVILCFDLKGPVKKAEGVESYKSNRVFTEDKATMYEQVPALREMLSFTHWTQADAEGHEADDCIGAYARAVEKQGHLGVIITTDNDLCSLVNSRVKIYMPAKTKEKTKEYYKDERWVLDRFGVMPYNLVAYRALAGDTSDNIAPIITDKGRLGQFQGLLNLHGGPTDAELIQKIHGQLTPEQVAQFEINYNLCTLHTPPKMNQVRGLNDPEKLLAVFKHCEMKSLYDCVGDFTSEPT